MSLNSLWNPHLIPSRFCGCPHSTPIYRWSKICRDEHATRLKNITPVDHFCSETWVEKLPKKKEVKASELQRKDFTSCDSSPPGACRVLKVIGSSLKEMCHVELVLASWWSFAPKAANTDLKKGSTWSCSIKISLHLNQHALKTEQNTTKVWKHRLIYGLFISTNTPKYIHKMNWVQRDFF